ncbi:polyprenol monophosphomannose synthase [candidate division WOR-3 bacterium]|jgi:dolichol-phosphate mannosyltransferase|nr:polyprenol monophosphomannose synthase [candidate division WOR-3 bacterium]
MKVLVIIPTYNEKENIEDIIELTLKQDKNIEILIVDDNSPDGTSDIIEKIAKKDKRIHFIRRPSKMGLGTAYVTGFKYAISNNYDYLFEMDADFSHNPNDIPRFLNIITENNYDIVIGSRYYQGVSVVNWPIIRLLLSYFANIYARIITGVPVNDLTGGYKCYRISKLKELNLKTIKSDGYSFQIEITSKLFYKKAKIIEIPIIFIDRVKGQSKMNKGIIWEAFWSVWQLRLQHIFGKI